MKTLKLIDFINNNPDWEKKLQEKPYCLSIKRDSGFILFAYSQIDSDFSNPIVQECRGLILRESNMTPACVPFFKFFNVQEGHAHTIDWSSANVFEKLDGSIIKVWFDEEKFYWMISTNGTIFAKNAPLQDSAIMMDGNNSKNYEELFCSVFPQELFYNTLQTNKTYMFELVSPFNKVVVPYPETKVYHIGTRNNETLEECDDDIRIEKPKTFNLRNLSECIQSAENLPFSEEGYVVVDKYFNRVKIKSPAYVTAHHLKNNGVVTWDRIIELIRNNGQDDFLSYYPEYTTAVNTVLDKINEFVNKVLVDWNTMPHVDDRKAYAMWAKKTICPAFFFWVFDDRGYEPRGWLWNQSNEKIIRWIGLEK